MASCTLRPRRSTWFDLGGIFHGIQLWINLPSGKKRMPPQYQDLQGRDSAMVTTDDDGGALVRVLAGDVDGHTGPGISHTPLAVTHVTLAPGARAGVSRRRDFNALAYVLNGAGTVGPDERPIRMGQTAVLVDGDTVVVELLSGRSPARPRWTSS